MLNPAKAWGNAPVSPIRSDKPWSVAYKRALGTPLGGDGRGRRSEIAGLASPALLECLIGVPLYPGACARDTPPGTAPHAGPAENPAQGMNGSAQAVSAPGAAAAALDRYRELPFTFADNSSRMVLVSSVRTCTPVPTSNH